MADGHEDFKARMRAENERREKELEEKLDKSMEEKGPWSRSLANHRLDASEALRTMNFDSFHARAATASARQNSYNFDGLEPNDKYAIVDLATKAAESHSDLITNFKTTIEKQSASFTRADQWVTLLDTQREVFDTKSASVIDNAYTAADEYMETKISEDLCQEAAEFFTQCMDVVMTLVSNIGSVINDMFQWIKNYLSKMTGKIKEAATSVYQHVDDGSKKAIGLVKTTTDILKTFLPFHL